MNTKEQLIARRYGPINWVGFKTLLQREIMRFWKVAGQTIGAPLISTLLFMMVFKLAFTDRGFAPIGQQIGFSDFLAPGLIMMAIIGQSFANSSSSLIIAKVQGNSVDFLTAPLSPLELTAAFVLGAAVRGMLVGVAGVLALAPLADMIPHNLIAILYYSLAASIMFGALGLITGVWADKFDNIATITNFVVTPLTFLSGTFYSISALPQPLESIGYWNPVFFLIDGFRYGFLGEHDQHGALLHGFLLTFALAVGLFCLAWAMIRAGYRLRA